MTPLALGEPAPDFLLTNQFGEQLSLKSPLGQNTLLVFYPYAFSAVCGSELQELEQKKGEFFSARTRLLAISTDSKYTLRRYAEEAGLSFDLLSDFWPHGAVADSYAVFDRERGVAQRGSFAIDAEGILRASFSSGVAEQRPWSQYQDALRVLTE
ncbi:peroxiredoxin [Psychromicrobium silvestre]|uniref:Peroxiredoxin n=1 Tax=Psychromicrobium silvestre TaxID=1645614 RepID=A0A7Y9LS41_9MICC|nr:redoxin domain-containing protein [Psychromicrobium silvestre]NYE94586.1 peroxiredoxin [Psychromicrobium silvestre]